MLTSSDVVWRPRVGLPMLSLSPSQRCRKRTRRRALARLHCSWMGNIDHRFLIPPLLRDEGKAVKSCRSGSVVPKFFLNDSQNPSFMGKSHSTQTFSIRENIVEEPWLWKPSTDSHIKSDCDVKERDISVENESLLMNYPVEEPWIFESFIVVPSKAEIIPDVFVNESDEVTQPMPENLLPSDEVTQPMPGNLLPEEESLLVTKEDSVSTVILINSSVCTVQRIAVLENDKLVELLLEPVKNNVQCDSVYLGVVTKLAPHMGGAFVNIGSPRPSFMDIRPNKEPFILPFFHSPVKEREHVDILGNGSLFSNGPEELDEGEHDQSEDEFEGHESHFHSDVLDVIKANVNCGVDSVVRHESEVDTQTSLEHLNEDVDQDAKVKVIGMRESKWAHVKKGSKIIVQVIKEGLGTKGPTLTAYPKLRSRFWVLITRCSTIGVSKKISGVERTRLRVMAKTLQPPGFGLTVRTVASGHSLEELQKDLEGLLSRWKSIVDHAKSAALAADEGVDGAVPVMLHRAMGQTLSVVQDYFNEKVQRMVVDSPRTYHEVTNYLQDMAPDLCDRIELYSKRTPIFDEYTIEEEINSILSKRVPLANGGYLVIEQTEALVSIDVNGGQCMLGQGTSQEKAILEVNLAAAKQIVRELRLRDIGGIIVVDFIDMLDDANKRLIYEEVKKAVDRDRSTVKVSELSRNGLMEITRKRVRPSVTFMISEPCPCCHATGRVEALETSFSKIEHEICRLLSTMDRRADPENPKSWPRFILRVDQHMCNYLTSGKRTRLAVLSSSLKVWILLKVARGLSRGTFEMKLLAADDNEHKNRSQGGPAITVLRPKEVVTHSPTRKVTLLPIKKWKSGGKS